MKKVIAIIILLAMIVTGIFAYSYISTPKKENRVQPKEKISIALNIPDMTVYGGDAVTGILKGYTGSIKAELLRDNLSVVTSADRKVRFTMDADSVKITSASYSLTPTDEDRLLDSGEIESTTENGVYHGEVFASAVMEENREYLLTLSYEFEELGSVNYYTRLMVTDRSFVEDQIAFARRFSDYTRDTEKSKELGQYMEVNPDLLNNNMGRINLSNSFNFMVWANLIPDKIGEATVSLLEVCVKESGVSGTYRLNYQVSALGNNEIADTYDIIETITVWTFDSKQYVLAYERRMNQVWTIDNNTVRPTFVDLGIQQDMAINYRESESGDFVSYEVNGALWLVDVKERRFTEIYTVDESLKDKQKVMPVRVSDDGRVDFVIYGYSAESKHNGKNGISVCKYVYDKNAFGERIFILSDIPANIMETSLEKLCYINDSVVYLLLDGTLYYSNLETKESGVVVSGLTIGNYAISAKSDVITYTTDGSINKATSLTVLNLTDGTANEIKAGKNKYLKICGYTGSNLIYGTMSRKSSDNVQDDKFRLTSLFILNNELEEIKKYHQEGVVITGVEISDTVINLKREKDGEVIDDDQLLDNTQAEDNSARASYYDDDKKYREVALALSDYFNSGAETTKNSKVVKSVEATEVSLEEVKDDREVFYVYACGELKDIVGKKNEAESLASQLSGVVVDNTGSRIWTFEEHYNDGKEED